MRSLLFAFLAISCGYLSAQSVSVGQWELRKRNANGTMTSYGVTAENGKAIGFTADVPAMLAVGGSLTIGSSTITSGTSGRALYNNSGVLGELDLASLYAPISHNQAWSTITSTPTTLAGYGITDAITAATAASTYAPLASPTFTGTITTGTGGIVSPNPLFPTRNITISQGTFAWQNVGGSGFGVQLTPDTPTDDRFVSFNPNGAIVSTADTGSVTSTMILNGTIANGDLAGSIALSKLAITGTPDGTKYLRDDGSWRAVSGGSLTDAAADRTLASPGRYTLYWSTSNAAATTSSGSTNANNISANIQTSAVTSARAQLAYPTSIGSAWLAAPGVHPASISFDRRITVGFSILFVSSSSNGQILVRFGANSTTTGELSGAGMGLRINNTTLVAQCHNGTTLTTSGTLMTMAASQQVDVILQSDGTGNVAVYLNGTLATTLTGGPTSTASAGFAIEALSNSEAAVVRCQFSPVHFIRS